jgi:hypothetical protein
MQKKKLGRREIIGCYKIIIFSSRKEGFYALRERED